MKNIVEVILLFGLLSLVACRRDSMDGGVSFVLEEGEVQQVTKGKVSDFAVVPEPESFRLEIMKAPSGAKVFDGLLGEWRPTSRLAPGEYEAVVSYGTEEEGPERPVFRGVAGFEIHTGETTEVKIKVTLANCVVKILCTETFQNYYPEWEFAIVTPYNPVGFSYTGEPVFVNWQFSVSGRVVNQAGQEFSLGEKSWKGEPARFYSIVYDVTNVGSVSVTISFDDTVQDVELGEILINS